MVVSQERKRGPDPGPKAAVMEEPIRVMLVDDSAVIRGMIDRWLRAETAISVVGTAPNGAAALRQLERCEPEVVVLDIEMPEMDGLAALAGLLALRPDLKVIMASTLTLRNAEISLRALRAGAADYIPKPESTRESGAAEAFQRELIAKIKALGAASRLHPGRRRAPPRAAATARPAPAEPHSLYGKAPIALRKPSLVAPRVLAIGSSTGGPQALFRLFGALKNRIRLPILITQHMPPSFTTILAEHLGRISGTPSAEGRDGEPLVPGRIYLAPGDWHMTVNDKGGQKSIQLLQTPPENFCRPAVDPMFRSLAAAYGPAVLAVVLTGMGQDGLRGGHSVVDAGGTIVAQDEGTSVVWGMPGAVATAGLCSAVLPLDQVAPAVERMAGRVAA